jgi:hypothetical protein
MTITKMGLQFLKENTPEHVLQDIAFSYNLLDQAAIGMTVFDQIKFVRDRYSGLSRLLGRAPTNPELAKALPSSGTMSHKWSDVTVLRKLLVIAQMEADVSDIKYSQIIHQNSNVYAQVLDKIFENRGNALLNLANLHARFAVRDLVHGDQVSIMCHKIIYFSDIPSLVDSWHSLTGLLPRKLQ